MALNDVLLVTLSFEVFETYSSQHGTFMHSASFNTKYQFDDASDFKIISRNKILALGINHI